MISPKQRGEFSTKLISNIHGSYAEYNNFHTLGIVYSILLCKKLHKRLVTSCKPLVNTEGISTNHYTCPHLTNKKS